MKKIVLMIIFCNAFGVIKSALQDDLNKMAQGFQNMATALAKSKKPRAKIPPKVPAPPKYIPKGPEIAYKEQMNTIIENNFKSNNNVTFKIIEKYNSLLDDFEEFPSVKATPAKYELDEKLFNYWASRALLQKYNDIYQEARTINQNWVDVLKERMQSPLMNAQLARFAYINAIGRYEQTLNYLQQQGKTPQDAQTKLEEFKAFEPYKVVKEEKVAKKPKEAAKKPKAVKKPLEQPKIIKKPAKEVKPKIVKVPKKITKEPSKPGTCKSYQDEVDDYYLMFQKDNSLYKDKKLVNKAIKILEEYKKSCQAEGVRFSIKYRTFSLKLQGAK